MKRFKISEFDIQWTAICLNSCCRGCCIIYQRSVGLIQVHVCIFPISKTSEKLNVIREHSISFAKWGECTHHFSGPEPIYMQIQARKKSDPFSVSEKRKSCI